MGSRPDDEFLRGLREKLDPELEMRVDEATNEVVVTAPGREQEIARVGVEPMRVRTEYRVLKDPDRSESWNHREASKELMKRELGWKTAGYEQTEVRHRPDASVIEYTKPVSNLEELVDTIYDCEEFMSSVDLRDLSTDPLSAEFVEAIRCVLGERFRLWVDQCWVDIAHWEPYKDEIARVTERPLRIEVESGLVALLGGHEPGLRPEVHTRAREILAEVVAPWEARGYRCRHDRRSRTGTWLCHFDKRVGSLQALIDEVFFAAEQEHTICFEDWGLPPPSAELAAAFAAALCPPYEVFRIHRRLVVRDMKARASVWVLQDPLCIQCELSVADLRPDLPLERLSEDVFHEHFPFCRERGYQTELIDRREEEQPPFLRATRPMQSISATIAEACWLLDKRIPNWF